MNERQKKVLAEAMTTLRAGARRAHRLVEQDAPLAEIASQLVALEALVVGAREAIDNAQGATAVLAQIGRAKALSTSKERV